MNRIDRARQAVDQNLDDLYYLLALRLIFPPDWEVVGIDKEISDLYVYPERLEASYRDEWRAIAIRAIYDHAFTDHWLTDEENLNNYLRFLKEDAIPKCIHNHVGLFRKLGEVLQIDRSDNTVAFPDPDKRALMKIIWPER